jgi:hypothetical protein
LQVESSTDNAEEEGNWAADEGLSAGLVDWRWLGGDGRVVASWGWLADGGGGSVLATDDGGDESWDGRRSGGGRAGGGGRDGGGLWLVGGRNVGVDREETSVVDLSAIVILDLESVVGSLLEVTSWGPCELSSVLNMSGNILQGIQVLGITLSQGDGDGLSSICLPGNFEWLSSLDDLRGSWLNETVETSGGELGKSHSGNNDGRLVEHFCGLVFGKE